MPTDTPAAGVRWWFVYYRVRRAELDAAVAAARHAQAALCREWPGLSAELMQRPSSDEGEVTLLESYRAEGWSEARMAALPAALEHVPWPHGPRRLEVFTPCA